MTKTYDFQAGEVLLINKPLEWTSFDVVNKIRWKLRKKFGVKKFKVGHAGTLDPLADGLLLICTGKKTKSIEGLLGLDKVYTGTITLGATTPSYDLETEIDQTFPVDNITEEDIRTVAENMTGEQEQLPPIFSAKKVDGKRAYELAREGKEVELKTKKINIKRFEITSIDLPKVNFLIECSTGTYIRSIASDFGKNLSNGAHLSALRREQIGQYSLNDSLEIDEIVKLIDEV